MEQAGQALVDAGDEHTEVDYTNLMALADKLLDRYKDPKRAERLYRRAIEVRPGLFEAYYGLAAALQRNNDIRGSLQVLEDYMARYGENEQLAKARQILQQALSKEQNP